jgi:hypothetical protein
VRSLEATSESRPGLRNVSRIEDAWSRRAWAIDSNVPVSVSGWTIRGNASVGWEITSPVLSDEPGFAEIARVGDTLAKVVPQLGLRVSHRTGLHVHLGWHARRREELLRLMQLVWLFEPALGTLVAPSRIARFSAGRHWLGSPNEFCRTLAEAMPARVLEQGRSSEVCVAFCQSRAGRYLSLNQRSLGGPAGTVEIRLHGGTRHANRILLWLSLWQQILWAAWLRSPIAAVPASRVITPSGDIVALAQGYLPSATQPEQQAFLRKLRARRLQILARWKRHPDLAPWLKYAARWQTPSHLPLCG